MKELDTVFPAFMVELVDYPKRMPFRAERASLGCSFFQGGYYSFDDKGEMDDCHFYVQYFR